MQIIASQFLYVDFCNSFNGENGDISAIAPKVSHENHSEHSVKIVVSEYGVADLCGKSPIQRAEEIIENCAHPDYRQQLCDYLKLQKKGHTPQNIYACYEFYKEFMEKKTMKGVDFSKF